MHCWIQNPSQVTECPCYSSYSLEVSRLCNSNIRPFSYICYSSSCQNLCNGQALSAHSRFAHKFTIPRSYVQTHCTPFEDEGRTIREADMAVSVLCTLNPGTQCCWPCLYCTTSAPSQCDRRQGHASSHISCSVVICLQLRAPKAYKGHELIANVF